MESSLLNLDLIYNGVIGINKKLLLLLFGGEVDINRVKNAPNISNSRLEFIRDANVTRKDERTDRMED